MANDFVWIGFNGIELSFHELLRPRYDGGNDKSSMGFMRVVIL